MSLVLLMSTLFLNLISSTYSADAACRCGREYKAVSSGNATIKCTGINETDDSKVIFTLYERKSSGICDLQTSLPVQPNKTNFSDTGNVSLIYNKDTGSAYFTIHSIRKNKSYCLSGKWSANNIKPGCCYINVTVEDPDSSHQPMENKTSTSPEKSAKKDKSHDPDPSQPPKDNDKYFWFLTMLILVAVAIVASAFFIYKRKLKTIQRQVYELQQAMQVEDYEYETGVLCQQPKPEASGHN